jgi:hypothetical protein
MRKTAGKLCPKCNSEIDAFGTCRRCGRPWSESLEEGEDKVDEWGEELPEAKSAAMLDLKADTTTTPDKPKAKVQEKDEIAILQEKSLLKLNLKKAYELVGISSQAYKAQRQVLLWINRLATLSEDDPKLQYMLKGVQTHLTAIGEIRNQAIQRLAAEETAAEKAFNSAKSHPNPNKKPIPNP